MRVTYAHAARATLITTVTDAVAFFASATSSVPVVSRFGLFMGTLCLVNYLLVVTYFASLLALHDRSTSTSSAAAVDCSCRAPLRAVAAHAARRSRRAVTASWPPSPPTDSLAKRLERFLVHVYLPRLLRLRLFVLSCGLLLVASLSYSLAHLRLAERDFQYTSFRNGARLHSHWSHPRLPAAC